MRRQRNGLLILAVSIMAAASGTTLAYLTSADEVENTFDVSEVKTSVVEEFEPPQDPKPGTTFRKSPRVHSDSDVDCYVRMMAVFTNDGEARCEPLQINPGWVLAGDGYYYWQEPLKPGMDTGSLFDQVKIRESVDQREQEPFDILVYSESVQAAGLTLQDAWAVVTA